MSHQNQRRDGLRVNASRPISSSTALAPRDFELVRLYIVTFQNRLLFFTQWAIQD
jgi:hypothetical protein